MVTVPVRGNSEQAIKTLKRQMQRELIFNKMKWKAFYESPSEKKARKKQESKRRLKKNYYRQKLDD